MLGRVETPKPKASLATTWFERTSVMAAKAEKSQNDIIIVVRISQGDSKPNGQYNGKSAAERYESSVMFNDYPVAGSRVIAMQWVTTMAPDTTCTEQYSCSRSTDRLTLNEGKDIV